MLHFAYLVAALAESSQLHDDDVVADDAAKVSLRNLMHLLHINFINICKKPKKIHKRRKFTTNKTPSQIEK